MATDGSLFGGLYGRRKLVQGTAEGSRGCGTDTPAPAQPPAQIRFDIKPKDPPAYHGKATEDVEVWSQQVDNYLQLLGGDDAMQVAYVGTLLQGAAQLWFQCENNAGRRPRTWTQLAESLCDRFGNSTKADYAQSQLSSMRQGKMNRPMTILYALRQYWTKFQCMRRVGSEIFLFGACIPPLPRKST